MVLAPKTEHGMKARFKCKVSYSFSTNQNKIPSNTHDKQINWNVVSNRNELINDWIMIIWLTLLFVFVWRKKKETVDVIHWSQKEKKNLEMFYRHNKHISLFIFKGWIQFNWTGWKRSCRWKWICFNLCIWQLDWNHATMSRTILCVSRLCWSWKDLINWYVTYNI